MYTYDCEKCKKTFITQDRLAQHVKDTGHKLEFQCKRCDFLAAKEQHLKQHFVDKHHMTFTCNTTGKMFFVNQVQGHARSFMSALSRSDYLAEKGK